MKTLYFATLFVLATTLTFATAWAQETHGIFMVVKGDIKVTGKDGKTDAAKVGKKVFPGDTIAAGADSRAKVVMSDKNVLNISPDSKIVIEKYENDGKDKKNVELNILYGKVRASVEQKYDGEKTKFNIKTPSAVAGVRGTDFITGYNPTTKVSQVITFSGVVAMGTPGPNGSITNPVFVRPGQMSSTSPGKAPEVPKSVPAEELSTINSDTVSVNEPSNGANGDSRAPASVGGDSAESSEVKSDAGSNANSSNTESRAPAATTPTSSESAAPVAAAPSMIDAKDLGPAVSKDISIRTPASAPTFIPPTAPVPQIPKNPFIEEVIRNQKSKAIITIVPN